MGHIASAAEAVNYDVQSKMRVVQCLTAVWTALLQSSGRLTTGLSCPILSYRFSYESKRAIIKGAVCILSSWS